MAEALINPRILTWARQRVGLTPDRLARSASTKSGRVQNWERGDARPSIRQARLLANALRIPLAYFYLSEPPAETLPLPDLRKVGSGYGREPSVDFLDVINAVRRKQDWFREYLSLESADPLPFVGSGSTDSSPEAVADDMREALNVDVDLRREAKSWSQFLTLLVRAAENSRILVFRSGIVGNNTRRTLDVAEFRGFAIVDPTAPVVFINSRDAKAAQIFTLAHEIAHLWIGESGVSNVSDEAPPFSPGKDIEQFCNSVAAEFLVPARDIINLLDGVHPLPAKVEWLARRFHVSTVMILRRCLELELMSKSVYFDQLDYEKSRQKQPNSPGTGGDFHRAFLARNGRLLTSAIFGSVLEGRTLYRDGSGVLEVTPATLETLARSRDTGV